jgi:heme/copper-type cytochrome/quinol oxidase subunit 2
MNLIINGFSDLWLVVMLIPIVVALVITILLNIDMNNTDTVLILPNFEVVWFVIPVIVFLCCGLVTFRIGTMQHSSSFHDILISLTASQWQWEGSIITAINILLIGDYLNVAFNRSSSDVLHSYSLLDFRVHTDCMPGKIIEFRVVVIEEIECYINCQELCGYRHSGITLILEL